MVSGVMLLSSARMFRRFGLLVLLWPLILTGNVAQGAGAPADSEFQLKGVLLSPTGRSALINGEVAREGDRIGRAEILAIEEKGVRLLIGADEYTVLVGSSAIAQRRPVAASHVERHGRNYRVRRGDTLSGITQHYVRDGISMNQMMVALFEENPEAFDGNINRIREGALLRIPGGDAVRRHALETATAEVVRQTKAWRSAHRQPVRTAKRPEAIQYGPVGSGETLSGIAVRIARDGVTMNQMMIALFRANPQAFNGNINMLLEGAVLRIPGSDALRDHPPGPATAEVLRHTELWRGGQQPRSAETATLMTAANRR